MSISAATLEGKYPKALIKDMLNNAINTFTLYRDSQNAWLEEKIPYITIDRNIDMIPFYKERNELQNGTQIISHS